MFVQTKGGQCLSAGLATNGLQVTVQKCNDLAAAQRWEVRTDGTIRSRVSGLCLDVAGGKTADQTPVQTATCNGTDAQRWQIEKGTVYTLLTDNKCLDTNVDNPVPGSGVVIWWCLNHVKQSWTPKS